MPMKKKESRVSPSTDVRSPEADDVRQEQAAAHPQGIINSGKGTGRSTSKISQEPLPKVK